MSRINSYKKGLLSELYASWFLRLKGYKILQPRYKTPFGEIDLIAVKSKSVVCVEVKYRPTADQAIEAVSYKSQKRIISAAQFFLVRHQKYHQADIRFDVVTVTPYFGIRHHKNAWYDSK